MHDRLQQKELQRRFTRVGGRVGLRRVLPLAFAVLVAGGAAVPASGQSGLRDQAARLKEQVAAEQAKIDATADGLAKAQNRVNELQARATKRQNQLDDTQAALVRARVHLTRLERKEAKAQKMLAENLVSTYKGGQPSFVTVVMNAHGFADLIERLDFVKRVANRNARILAFTRDTRADVQKQSK